MFKRLSLWVFGFSAVVSCGQVDSSSLSADETISFGNWCRDLSLANCSEAEPGGLTEAQWEFGLIATKQLLDSPTKLSFTRDNFDTDEVQDLLAAIGTTSILKIIEDLPWEILQKTGSVIEIKSQEARRVELNDLTYQIDPFVSIENSVSGIYQISGLALVFNGEAFALTELDMTTPYELTVKLGDQYISEMPAEFLLGEDELTVPDLGAINIALPALLFSPNFAWQDLGQLDIQQDQIAIVSDALVLIKDDLPDPRYLPELQFVLDQANSFVLGGNQTDERLLFVGLNKAVTCTATIGNIPLVGQINFDLNLEPSIGLRDLRKTRKGVELRSFGMSTTIGSINRIRIEDSTLTIRIGLINIPIDLGEEPDPGRQPDIERLICQ